jgi:flagellar protein FlgJ
MADALEALPAPTVPPAADPALRARIEKTAKDFEASFLQVMLGQMFDSVDAGAFGGGSGEAAFKSFLTDAFAKSMAERGGVGLSKDLTREMLKLQGLS